jgi:hypothetical protein
VAVGLVLADAQEEADQPLADRLGSPPSSWSMPSAGWNGNCTAATNSCCLVPK